jgi:hypothetical protein
MKTVFLFIISLISLTDAFALDSDWKLCKGDVIVFDRDVKLVVNAFEHRNGNGRAADLTLIYGSNLLKGVLNTSESTSGTVNLKGANSSFKGNVAIDYGRGIMSISGKLALGKDESNFKANLECETL